MSRADRKESARLATEPVPAMMQTEEHSAGGLQIITMRKGGIRGMYLKKDGISQTATPATGSVKENVVNLPETMTVTITMEKYEQLILANDRMRSAIERLTHFLEDEAGEEYISRNAVARLLNLDPVALNKKMP